MDIQINIPVSGATQSYKPPQSTTANTEQPPVTVQPVQRPVPPAALQSTNSDVQSQYEEVLKQAILAFKDVYVISDKEFSFFKDASGQLITRYVSLRDNSVTYVPAPVFLRNVQAAVNDTHPMQLAIET